MYNSNLGVVLEPKHLFTYVRIPTIRLVFFFAVPAVGFQVTESYVNESAGRKFTCVEILSSSQPLTSDIVIEFYTQDGSAEGK